MLEASRKGPIALLNDAGKKLLDGVFDADLVPVTGLNEELIPTDEGWIEGYLISWDALTRDEQTRALKWFCERWKVKPHEFMSFLRSHENVVPIRSQFVASVSCDLRMFV